MFVNTDFVSEIMHSVFLTGKIEIDDPIFQEFNTYLSSLDLKVAFSTFHLKPYSSRKAISSDNGSSIGIYLGATENFKKNGFSENGNWNGKYNNTELIKEEWQRLAKKNNLPEAYYNFISYVWVYDFEKNYLQELLNASKIALTKKILSLKYRIKPEHIFGSSTLALSIIYKNKRDFDFAHSKNYFTEITAMANDVLSANDKFRMFNVNSIEVNFYHAKMEGLNIYGLSRED